MPRRTFSICIPVRNGERYLAEAIGSAVQQTRRADEILVLDDASSDHTSVIAQRTDWSPSVRYIRNEYATGWADAFNRAAAAATSDFVVILSADDMLAPECLASLERGLEAHPGTSHCFAGNWYADEAGVRTGSSPTPHSHTAVRLDGAAYARRYMEGVAAGQPIHRFLGTATSRRLWVDQCPIRPEAGLIGDNDFFLRLSRLTDVVGISEPLSTVRHHGGSVTSGLESLNLRLAEDYLFETRSFLADADGLDSVTLEIIQRLARQFVGQLLFESIWRGRARWFARARELHEELERLAPTTIYADAGFVEKLAWRLTSLDRFRFVERILSVAAAGHTRLKSAQRR